MPCRQGKSAPVSFRMTRKTKRQPDFRCCTLCSASVRVTPRNNAILYHQPLLADIADSGTVEPKVEGPLRDFKVAADDQANPEPNLIGFESASQPWVPSFFCPWRDRLLVLRRNGQTLVADCLPIRGGFELEAFAWLSASTRCGPRTSTKGDRRWVKHSRITGEQYLCSIAALSWDRIVRQGWGQFRCSIAKGHRGFESPSLRHTVCSVSL